MPTKLSRYCEGIMEAAWLVAVIVVPVFFNVYSSRIFEPDKIALLRTLALVILAAWLVKLFERGGVLWDRIEPGGSRVKTLLGIPLVALVSALALIYLVATLFSVTPSVSLWGSYQRLQGTYTTFSYLVVFASMAANLRRRAQVERLIGAVILASLPVSLYGVLQRFEIDPIPWGGDTSRRIASNMGNSIFVGAYLVMAFPLTALRIVESFEALLTDRGRLGPNFARSTGYVFIASLQLIALYFSGSRGPWLGWAASLVFIWLGLSLIWRARWLTITGVVLALSAGTFLVVLNIPSGPLESLSTRPEFGRLGQLLDAESRTAQVRTLIWQGASELVQPHEPLEFPDGDKDTFNFLRPLIGYGPESMYVAYNRFYPPELTLVERRNASPDRSHNETWDSLAITGVVGLFVYLALFGSVLYYGLKWLGLIRGARQRSLFLALLISGGTLSTVTFVLWRGLPYLGVVLPFGMILGVLVYLGWTSLFGRFEAPRTPDERMRAYVLLALLAAIVAHWVEINFGIAIVATRTYFWVYTGLLLLVGYVMPLHDEYRLTTAAPSGEAPETPAGSPRRSGRSSKSRRDRKARTGSGGRRRREDRSSARSSRRNISGWLSEALIVGLIVSVLLVTLGYEFISNASRETSAGKLLWVSFTYLSKAERASYGVLALIVTSWLVGVIVLASESLGDLGDLSESYTVTWGKMLALALGVSALLALVYWMWHAEGLAALARSPAKDLETILGQVRHSESLLTTYYIYLFALIFGMGAVLPSAWPVSGTRSQAVSVLASLGALVVVFVLAAYTNLRVIQADIAFKTADLFSQGDTWPVSIAIYNHANELAPSEDYYYLFLGRAYLEYAKTLQSAVERETLISRAEQDLRKAQDINPLNTDHTANLARLYSLWSTYTQESLQRELRAQTSDDYFSGALTLSPNNARLWDEWAVLYLNILKLPEEAYERLMRALELDPFYDWTYGLLGDYLVRYVINDPEIQPEEKQAALTQAAEYYTQALEHSTSDTRSQLLYSYAITLGGLHAQLGDLDQAIEAYQRAIEIDPTSGDRWRVELVLARLYAQKGDQAGALAYAHSALDLAPDDQKEAIQATILQLGGQP